ncbi:MAG: 3-hydroxyacyl-CoA dehydrogenase family protein [Pseudobacter sp.]|uniref:3-hydroxyacyl-CoA dehydrogenase family protein n=1 Tax=Pseudobacter sp. TaxID=2045420 RepID=UPI003F7F25EE
MTIAILADDTLKNEWLQHQFPESISFIWADSMSSLTMLDADAYVDLLFRNDPERNQHLARMLPKPVIVNAVEFTTEEIRHPFVRINGWPTLLQRSIAEIVLPASITENSIKEIFTALNWQYQLAPDVPGMITARVLAMIINEAYFTLGAEVSSREEIDTAMKLGTNYPMGPFEWSEKIGLQRVYALLQQLHLTDERYAPAPALKAAIQ